MKEHSLTGYARLFRDDEIIVSKTDLKGRLTYCNDVFLKISDYSERDLLGKPHNIIRHPHMPRCIFKLLWSTIQKGDEIFAYVVNRSRNGDHYWVLAHITPDRDGSGTILGYHSSRRSVRDSALTVIEPLYKSLLDTERQYSSPKDAMVASSQMLSDLLAAKGMNYDQFILSV